MESRKPKQKVEPGPEVPTDGAEVGVSYISFEDVTDCADGQDNAVLHSLI